MSIPTGYEKLAVIGIAWKNEYVQGTAYKTMNAVYYNGSTYVALRDNPTGPPAADGANWQYLAKGFEQQLLSAITALDTSGVLGQAGATVGGQALMDAIADKVMTKLIAKSQIVNNLLATEPGNVLDATQGKALKDDITELYSDLGKANEKIADMQPTTSREVITMPDGTYCHTLIQPGWYNVYASADSPNQEIRWLIHVYSVQYGDTWVVIQDAYFLVSALTYVSPKTRSHYNNGSVWAWSPWV